MSSFLQLLAKDLVSKYNYNFEHLTIIFPNKRAGLFLAEELSKLINQPVWMPEIITLSEFIEKQAGLKKAEDLTLIIKLYKSYIKASGVEEKFEDFYFWGNMLLSDFDDIDKYLADAQAIFSNLVALKELELSFPYLSAEQIEAIKSFWGSFNPEKYSREQTEFLKVWDKLYPTYDNFRKELFQQNLCYEGMGQRYFFEHIEAYENNNHLIFAGFNALNSCEKQIFSFYQNNKQASFYWDYDIYYSVNEYHEAGLYIRENLKRFPNELGPEHFNNFRYNGKSIEYIAVPSSIGQAKLIPKLTEYLQDKDNFKTAVVLCDEKMLIPAIHSIPEEIRKVNITMGYPAQNTSVAALISMLGDLRNYAKQEGVETYYYYKPVVALLNHKLIKDSCPEDINRITNYINQKNIVYVAEKSLQFNRISKAIFSSGEKNISDYLLNTLKLLSESFEPDNEAHPIEKEFIFTLYTYIQSLQNTFEEEHIAPESKLYMRIITKIVNAISIPFSGEPLEGLQLMGLMETRMLDFTNLIILSANEGILPKNGVISSFIPYNLRVGFRLPTPEHQDALFAYYFYRLIQRAKNIKILYTSTTQGLNSGEMSRFLYQIKYESGLSIKESNFQNHISVQENRQIEISKNESILQALDAYTLSEDKALSPSALNTYMECPLKFYFKYIAGIKEKEEMTEELDHRLLGTIFHECSESLYRTVSEHEITKEVLERLSANGTLISEHIKRSYLTLYDKRVSQLIDSSSNELILDIVKKYVREMFNYDRKVAPFRLLSMEEFYRIPVNITTDRGPKNVFIGGVIDRVDKTEGAVRIIDYKTGADNTTFKDIPSVFDPENPTRNKAAFQTMLYCLMYAGQHTENIPLLPGIYSTKLLFAPDYDHRLKYDKDHITDFRRYQEEFRENLIKLLEEIFSSTHSFRQTTIEKKCRTCNYNSICRR